MSNNNKNINAINVNTRNFNYHTLSRDGIRGGMEWITMPERDWGFVNNNQVQNFGGGFNIKGSHYGTLYVEPAPAGNDGSGNFLVFVDNSGIGHTIAGSGGIGYWTTAAPGVTALGGGGYIKPVFDISAIITYNHNNDNDIINQSDFWNKLEYKDSSGQDVSLNNAALIVMDKMQFLEASGNSADSGDLGTIRYTYLKTDSSTELDPSGSSFQGRVLDSSGQAIWIKFGGDTDGGGGVAPLSLWKLASNSSFLEPSGSDISGIKLINTVIQGTDNSGLLVGDSIAKGKYSVAIGWNCVTGDGAADPGDYGSGDQAVSLGYNSRATGQSSIAMGAFCEASGNFTVAMGHNCLAGGSQTPPTSLVSDIADGYGAVAMGFSNKARGYGSVAMGVNCSANGIASFADGSGCIAAGNYAVAMGLDCSASGQAAVAMGEYCDASGDNSVALGRYCVTEPSGFTSVCLGNICRTYDNATVALGSSARASGRKTITAVASNVDISNVFFVYRSSLGNSVEFVDATEVSQTGTAADFGSKIGLRYRSYDGSASELIFAAPAGSGGGAAAGTYGYKMITTTTSKPGGGIWNGSSCSVLDVTGLSLSDLTPTTRCKITIVGAGGGGGGGIGDGNVSNGGGGGGGAVVVFQNLPDASWNHPGLLTLGLGGSGGTGNITGTNAPGTIGGNTAWKAIMSAFVNTDVPSGNCIAGGQGGVNGAAADGGHAFSNFSPLGASTYPLWYQISDEGWWVVRRQDGDKGGPGGGRRWRRQLHRLDWLRRRLRRRRPQATADHERRQPPRQLISRRAAAAVGGAGARRRRRRLRRRRRWRRIRSTLAAARAATAAKAAML